MEKLFYQMVHNLVYHTFLTYLLPGTKSTSMLAFDSVQQGAAVSHTNEILHIYPLVLLNCYWT